ncbi:tyrosine-type recombinase/integrase [Planctomycetota bacterium]
MTRQLDKSKWLDEDEIKVLLTQIESCKNMNIKMLIIFGIGTGARIGEMISLRIQDLYQDGDGEVKTSIDITGKRNVTRRLPISDFVRKHFQEFYEYKKTKNHSLDPSAPVFLSNHRRQLSYSAAHSALARWREKLGLNLKSFHVLRHSLLSKLAVHPQGGVLIAKEIAGHVNISTTGIYLHAHPKLVRTVINEATNF